MMPRQQDLQSVKLYGSNVQCPVCNGTGFIVYAEEVEGYPAPLEYASPCQACSGKQRISDTTGIPIQFKDAEISSFGFGNYLSNMDKMKRLCNSFVERFAEWKKYGKGLYLWSKTPGSGKTLLACSLGRSVMIGSNVQMGFVTAPDYISKVGESYKKEHGAFDESKIYRECGLLILDDLGTQNDKEWQRSELFRLIDGRTNAGKVTLFTSNYPPEQSKLDNRTVDRIIKSSVVLQMPEESLRRKDAQKEQYDFLSRMIT